MSEGYSSDRRGQVEPSAHVFSGNGLLITVTVIGVLYFGREVFIPIVLAILLSFVLAIPINVLQRWRVPRGIAVSTVVVLAFCAILSIGAMMTTQLTQLAGDLPRYQSTIQGKLTSLKDTTSGHGPLARVGEMIQDLAGEFGQPARPTSAGQAGAGGLKAPAAGAAEPQPIPVRVVGSSSGTMETISSFVTPLLHPLETTGLVAIFVIFILLQRGDLRNRLIRLAGSHDLQRTTAAMNDAAGRLSRFFLVQVCLNATFGIVVGTGLAFIGVPSPVLWGILAAISRFVPYVGVVLAAGFPLILSAAVDPNWGMLIEVAVLFAVVELIVGQAVEPLVYGHSTGLSPVAVIVSVTFWAWLWGGVGLLLATPLTVCLVVLGRHVEALGFLDVMFGDRPPLTAAESFYQRMLAGNVAEALEQAETFLKQHTLVTYYDEIALKGLALAQIDAARGALTTERLVKVETSIAALVDTLEDHEDAPPDDPAKRKDAPRADGDADLDAQLDRSDEHARTLPTLEPTAMKPDWTGSVAPILCVGGRNQLDRAGAQMLSQLLTRHGLRSNVDGSEILASNAVDTLPGQDGIRLVVLSFLDTSSQVHVRYAVRRLRRRLPGIPIILGSWALEQSEGKSFCEVARTDGCVTRLGDALQSCLDAAASTSPAVAGAASSRSADPVPA